ncbi:MAG: hypothetical protein H8E14_15205 [Candidatus Marinimicrobia bacterium]|nr:hypothetical protein [Candidatus Neomarinimicrobiota bacterium]
MKSRIDIREFGGVVTKADPADLPARLSTMVKNFRTLPGMLEKTFGAGKIANIPAIHIDEVEISGTAYDVKNIFCFIHEDLPTTGHRFLLMCIHPVTNQVRPFWWDYYNAVTADVDDFLAFATGSYWIHTLAAHNMEATDKILVQDCIVSGQGAPDISGADDFVDVTEVSSQEIFTGTVGFMGKSFFSGSVKSVAGGKIPRVSDSRVKSFTKTADICEWEIKGVAFLEDGSDLLVFAGMDVSDLPGQLDHRLYWRNGLSIWAQVSATNWDALSYTANSLKIAGIYNWNSSVIVAITYTSGGNTYGKIFRFYIDSSTLTDAVLYTSAANGVTGNVRCKMDTVYTGGSQVLLVLYPGTKAGGAWPCKIVGIDTSWNDAEQGLPTGANGDEIVDMSIILKDESTWCCYLSYVTSGGTPQLQYTHNFSSYSVDGTTLPVDGGFTANRIECMTTLNVGQQTVDKSLIIALKSTDAPDVYNKIYYASHDQDGEIDGFTIINDDLPYVYDDADAFEHDGKVVNIFGTDTDPSGTDKLYVYYEYYTSAGSIAKSGRIFRIHAESLGKSTIIDRGAVGKLWAPRCFCDIVTTYGQAYTKAYIALFGDVENQNTAACGLWMINDVSWDFSWSNADGDCEYAWRDLVTMFDLTETIYHKYDRNPIVANGQILRMLPGNVGEISSNEAKGLWLGYLDRDFFWNSAIKTIDDFFLDVNSPRDSDLTLSCTVSDEIGSGGNLDLSSKTYYYKITVLFDGVQETLLPDTYYETAVSAAASTVLLDYLLTISTMNDRITAFRIYRSEDNLEGPYYFILEVSALGALSPSKDPNLVYASDAIVGWGLHDPDKSWSSLNGRDVVIGDSIIAVASNGIDTIVLVSVLVAADKIWNQYYTIWGISSVKYAMGFEGGGVDGWQKVNGNPVSNDGSLYHSGAHSLMCPCDEGVAAGDCYKIITGLTENTTYYIQVWVISDGGSQTITLNVEGTTDAESVDSDWRLLEVEKATGGGDTDLRIDIYGNDVSNNAVNVDDVVVSDEALHDSGTSGYAGRDVIISDDEYDYEEDTRQHYRVLVGTAANGNNDTSAQIRRVINNVRKALKVDAVFSGDYLGSGLKAYLSNYYIWQLSASGIMKLKVYDKGLDDGAVHSLAAEDYVKVNGRFARILDDRMIQINTVLDPGNENEKQVDGLNYSPVGQYDIMPVSNLDNFPDREGGGCTGLAILFSRAIIAEQQALFLYHMVDPSDPDTWLIEESKHNIGNIAAEGMVEVHDSVYVVYYDGIYKLDANFLASTEATPTKLKKITDPIEDIYLLITDLTSIRGIYDQSKNEIIYDFDNQGVWAYHIFKDEWRQHDTTSNLDILTFDQEAEVVAWDDTDDDIKSFNVAESLKADWKSARFVLGTGRKQLVRYCTIWYECEDNVTVFVYLDGEVSPSFSKVLTWGSKLRKFAVKRRANFIDVRVANPTNGVAAFKLYKIEFELEVT